VAVVSDTSPLSYLVLIGKIDALHVLYGEILIPPAVAAELSHLMDLTLRANGSKSLQIGSELRKGPKRPRGR
jgi:predicted nucleic acid-binding protein